MDFTYFPELKKCINLAKEHLKEEGTAYKVYIFKIKYINRLDHGWLLYKFSPMRELEWYERIGVITKDSGFAPTFKYFNRMNTINENIKKYTVRTA